MKKVCPKYDTCLFVSLSRSIAFNWLLMWRALLGCQCCSCQGRVIVNPQCTQWMCFWLLLKAFTGSMVPDVVEASLCTESSWIMLLQRHIQSMQTSTQPLCSLSSTYLPWGSQWDWNSAFTSCFICVQSWNFSINLADVMKVSCFGYQRLSWDTSWLNVFICHNVNTQGPGWVSLGWNSETPSLPYLHSLSPPEYLDPSKWTWTKVLDWAAATQEFPMFSSLSATDLSEFGGITWFCCW